MSTTRTFTIRTALFALAAWVGFPTADAQTIAALEPLCRTGAADGAEEDPSCWMTVEKLSGCHVWRPNDNWHPPAKRIEAVSFEGEAECGNSKLSGTGKTIWRYSYDPEVLAALAGSLDEADLHAFEEAQSVEHEGSYVNGRLSGEVMLGTVLWLIRPQRLLVQTDVRSHGRTPGGRRMGRRSTDRGRGETPGGAFRRWYIAWGYAGLLAERAPLGPMNTAATSTRVAQADGRSLAPTARSGSW